MSLRTDSRRTPGWAVAVALGGFATLVILVRFGVVPGAIAALGELLVVALAVVPHRRIDRTRAVALALIVLCLLGFGAPVLRSLTGSHASATAATTVHRSHEIA